MTSEETKSEIFGILVAVVFVLGFAALIAAGLDEKANDADKLKEEANWRAASCPTYQAECGGKHKYACERKAAVVGRNQVGDIFVTAKATC